MRWEPNRGFYCAHSLRNIRGVHVRHRKTASLERNNAEGSTDFKQEGIHNGSVHRDSTAAPLVLLAGAEGTQIIPPYLGNVAR
jgi:hypothetical protein